MIDEDYNFDNFIANEDMQSFSSDSGYESLVSDDDDVDWLENEEEAVGFLQRMLLWLNSIDNVREWLEGWKSSRRHWRCHSS